MSRRSSMDSQEEPLIDPHSLPNTVSFTVLQQAGLHTRQVCRAYRALHPPLLALTLDGLPTPETLLTALPRLPSTLTSLDLRAVQAPDPRHNPHPITPAALAAIPATLPHLQCLHLPLRLPHTLLPTLLATLHACPHLHTLTINGFAFTGDPNTTVQMGTLLQPPLAARLRSLTLPGIIFNSTLGAAPAGALPHLTAFKLSFPAFGYPHSIRAAHLAAFTAAAPALQSLQLYLRDSPHQPHLTALIALTALTISLMMPLHGHNDPPGGLLPHVGSLVNLRSLSLTFESGVATPSSTGWLAPLTLLTHLSLQLRNGERHMEHADRLLTGLAADRLLTGVAAAAARQLPSLRSLHLGLPPTFVPPQAGDWLAADDSFFHCLAAATQLQRLSLQGSVLPPAEAHVLSSLQGLTALLLDLCSVKHPTDAAPFPAPLQWISALTSLQHVALHRVAEDAPNAVGLQHLQVLVTLPRLHTLQLQLRYLTSPELPGLLTALAGRLERLLLGVHSVVGTPDVPLDLLAGLTRLRVLDMRGAYAALEVARPLQLPDSLRKCYYMSSKVPADVLQQMRERHPLVAFQAHHLQAADAW